MNNYSVKIWMNNTIEWRHNLPYKFAYDLATKGGYDKVQLIRGDGWGTIELEV